MLNTLLSFLLSLLIISTAWADNTATDVSPKKDKAVYPLLQLKILSVSENWINDKKAIVISFSHPLKPDKNYDSFLSITENGIALKGHWQLSKDGKQLYFVNIKDDKQYQIFIRPGLVANNGLKILSPKQFNLNSKATKPDFKFIKLQQVYLPTKFSGIYFQSKGIIEQDISIYQLNQEKQQAFINKLKQEPDLDNWNILDIKSFCTLITNQVIKNKTTKPQKIAISFADKNLTAGIYFAIAIAKTKSGSSLKKIAYFSLSDFDIEIDKSKSGLELITYSTKQAKLLDNSSLIFIDKDKIIKSEVGKTAYQFFSNTDPIWLLAKNNHQIILKKVSTEKSYNIEHSKNYSHIILDKKVYELGARLNYSILARSLDNKALENKTLKIILLNNKHEKIAEKLIKTSALGVVSSYFQLPKDDETFQQLKHQGISLLKGQHRAKSIFQEWIMRVYSEDDEQPKLLASEKFYTTPIKNPAPNLMIHTDSNIIFPNKKNTFTLQGILSDQIPADQANVDILQAIKWVRFPSKKYQEFSFGVPEDQSLTSQYQIKDIQLNAKGKAKFTLPEVKNKVNSILSVKLKGELELGSYPLATTVKTLTYWPAKRLIGVRSLHWGSEDISQGITFEIINIDPENHLHAVENLDVSVYQENIDDAWQYIEGLGWQKNKKATAKLVKEKTLSLLSDDIGSLDFSLDKGSYKLEIKNPETGLVTIYPFSIGNNIIDNNLPPDQLILSIDKKRYKNDDTISLLIKSRQSGDANISLFSKDESYNIGSIRLNKGETSYQFSLKSLKKDRKLSEQFFNKELKIQVIGFYSYKNETFTSKGVITLPIEYEPEIITAKLQDEGTSILLHSTKYKNKAVVIEVEKTKGNNDLKMSPKMQASYFDKQGNAILNNAEMQLKAGQTYQVNLYFQDHLVHYQNLQLK